MNITASWIWPADSDGRGFNLCSVFRRDFRLESAPASARILITADSYYRLKINGQWIGDGPAPRLSGALSVRHLRHQLLSAAGTQPRRSDRALLRLRHVSPDSAAGRLPRADRTHRPRPDHRDRRFLARGPHAAVGGEHGQVEHPASSARNRRRLGRGRIRLEAGPPWSAAPKRGPGADSIRAM